MDNDELLQNLSKLKELMQSIPLDKYLHDVVVLDREQPKDALVHLDNGIGSVSLNAEGGTDMAAKYRERIRIGTDSSGDPIFEWATGNTKDELHRSISRLLQGERPEKSRRSGDSPLWDDYAWQWFNLYHKSKLRPKTLVKDTSLMKLHVAPAFKGKPLDTIRTSDIQSYLQTRKHMCHSMVRDIMWMMRAVFVSAVEDEIILKNPMDSSRICNPSEKKDGKRKALTNEEQLDIIAHIPDIKNVNGRRLMALLMFTCLRPCEIYGLKWSDIDAEQATITVNRDLVFANGVAVIGETKTPKSMRRVPVDKRLFDLLEPWGREGYVISPLDGTDHYKSESSFKQIWRSVKKCIDVHGMTPYVGRHTYASNMSRAGVPIKTAMEMMGHTDERMLLRTYTHIDKGDLLNACKATSSLLTPTVSE